MPYNSHPFYMNTIKPITVIHCHSIQNNLFTEHVLILFVVNVIHFRFQFEIRDSRNTRISASISNLSQNFNIYRFYCSPISPQFQMALELWSIDDHTFSRLIRPSSMRSTYWTYFGFPADDQNKILTRRKIICTLCNMAIAYNRNTTNLKVHLRSRHPELNVATQPKLKRVRYVYQPVNEVADDLDEEVVVDAEVVVDGSVTSDFNSELIIDSDDIVKQESMLIEKDTEDVGYKIEYIEGDFKEVHVGDDVQSDFSVEIEEISEVEAEYNKRSVIIENTIDMAFQKIFISSMSTDITDGNDFRKFCSLLNYNFPERREVYIYYLIKNLNLI